MKEEKERYLTTNQGVTITDNQNSLTVGERSEERRVGKEWRCG